MKLKKLQSYYSLFIFIILAFSFSSIFSYASSQLDSDGLYVVKILKSNSTILQTLHADRIKVINSREYYVVAIVSQAQLYNLKARGFEVEIMKSYGRAERELLFAAAASASPTLENEHVSITVNYEGAFTMQRATDDKWLLYPRASTTAFSVKVDDAVYWTGGYMPISTPLTIVDANTAYIEYVTSENVRIRHTYSLAEKAVKFEVQAWNNDSSTHHVQVRYLFDTQVDENDGSPLYAQGVVDSQGSSVCTYETEIPSITFSEWKGYDIWPNPELASIGTISTIPSRMVFAWWPNARYYSWNYTPDPDQRFYTPGYTYTPYSDSCVLIYLDLGNLAPGETATATTYYGIGAPSLAGLEALINALNQLRYSTKDTIDYNVKRAADMQADVIYAIQLKNKEKVDIGFKIAKAIFTIIKNPYLSVFELMEITLLRLAATKWLIDVYGSARVPNNEALRWNLELYYEKLKEWWDTNKEDMRHKDKKSISAMIMKFFKEELHCFVDSNGQPLPNPGTNGLEDYVNDKFDNYINYLRNNFTNDYPVNIVVAKIQSVNRTILNSKESELLLLPINDNVPHELQILGSSLQYIDKISSDLSHLATLEWVSIGSIITSSLAKVALIIVTHGISSLAELALGMVSVTAATFIDLYTLATEVVIFFKSHLLGQSICSEVTKIAGSSRDLIDYLLNLELGGWAACYIDNTKVQIVENSFQMEDAQIPSGENSASVSGSIDVINTGYDNIPVTAYANIYRTMSVNGEADDYPIMIVKSDTYDMTGGGNYTLNLHPTTLIGSETLQSDSYIGVAYLAVGPSIIARRIGPIYDEFYVNSSSLRGLISRVTRSIGQSLLNSGEQWESSYHADSSAVYSDITLFFPGSDLDLHVYDSYGNHVGVNYATGQVEIEIPGAIYNGSTNNPEIIRLPHSGGQTYTVRVVAIQTTNKESFEVIASDVPFRESILAVIPRNVQTSIDLIESDDVSVLISAKEVGGQTDYTGLVASCTDLVSGTNKISSSNIMFDIPASQIPAGGSVDITISIKIPMSTPFDTPSGTYSGTINVGPNSISIPISLEVLRSIQAPLNLTGEKVLNRSLYQAEYINVLKWESNPDNENKNIIKYRIYQKVDNTQSLLIELGADQFEYWHRKVEKDKRYTYALVAVNNENKEGEPAYITIQ